MAPACHFVIGLFFTPVVNVSELVHDVYVQMYTDIVWFTTTGMSWWLTAAQNHPIIQGFWLDPICFLISVLLKKKKNTQRCFILCCVCCVQAYRSALDSLGHCEYALKGGFHLKPKAIEAVLQVRAAESTVVWSEPAKCVYRCCFLSILLPMYLLEMYMSMLMLSLIVQIYIYYIFISVCVCACRVAVVRLRLSRQAVCRPHLSRSNASYPQSPCRSALTSSKESPSTSRLPTTSNSKRYTHFTTHSLYSFLKSWSFVPGSTLGLNPSNRSAFWCCLGSAVTKSYKCFPATQTSPGAQTFLSSCLALSWEVWVYVPLQYFFTFYFSQNMISVWTWLFFFLPLPLRGS